ncbi:hypothetical protein ACIPWI_00850 [Streptomyces sp. NPDC090046]|uniref:hypothetical protein n=1 Tax=Streptomyces sp. NPDC090046 TaxID=3365928 RepID=UPI0038108D24
MVKGEEGAREIVGIIELVVDVAVGVVGEVFVEGIAVGQREPLKRGLRPTRAQLCDQARPDARKEWGMHRSSLRMAATTTTVINPPLSTRHVQGRVHRNIRAVCGTAP